MQSKLFTSYDASSCLTSLSDFPSHQLQNLEYNGKVGYIDIAANLTDDMYKGIYNNKVKHPNDIEQVLERARKANVIRIILLAGNLKDTKLAIKIADEFDPECRWLFTSVGVHPTQCNELHEEEERYILELCNLIEKNPKRICCIGEMGLDFDRLNFCKSSVQIKCFNRQFDLVDKFKLPMLLHLRNASKPFFEILKENLAKWEGVLGVVHSFDGSIEDLNELIALGFFIGINGCSLKTKENLMTVKSIPIERLLLETDSPYCSIRNTHASKEFLKTKNAKKAQKPQNWESSCQIVSRNEPANIVEVAEVVYEIIGKDKLSYPEFCDRIIQNTFKVFPTLK